MCGLCTVLEIFIFPHKGARRRTQVHIGAHRSGFCAVVSGSDDVARETGKLRRRIDRRMKARKNGGVIAGPRTPNRWRTAWPFDLALGTRRASGSMNRVIEMMLSVNNNGVNEMTDIFSVTMGKKEETQESKLRLPD